MKKNRCSDCLCWQTKEDIEWGFCRANALQGFVYPGKQPNELSMIWPSTMRNEWCINDFKDANNRNGSKGT